MYNIQQIQTAFTGMVGFKQPDDPSYPKLDSALTASTSGRVIQSVHALCTMENIYNCAPEFSQFEYPAWSSTVIYTEGNVVSSGGIDFVAKGTVGPVATLPGSDGANWKPYNGFSDWLKQVYNEACANLCSELLMRKKLNEATKSLLESMQVFAGFGMMSDKVIKRGRFVGWQIFPSKQEGITIRIDKIGFQADTIQTGMSFYLYHSSQAEPLKVMDFDITRPVSFSWFSFTDVSMTYLNGQEDSDGVYYLGYYESDLTGQVINKRMNLMQPCPSCDAYDVMAFNKWSRYTSLTAIVVPSFALNEDRTLFDQTKLSYSYDTNFGMNLQVTVMCDLTAFFIKNKNIFADSLAKQIALDLLNKIAYNTRMNAISDKIKALAMADLDENLKSGSFRAQYCKQIDALDYDFSGFNSACLPCNDKRGISMESI